MTSIGGVGYNNPYSIQQSLFNEIDTNGSGSITKSSLETAVTTAGGTTAAADALYADLDPNNTGSVTEQQFSQNLPSLPFSDAVGAQLIGFQAQGWPSASGAGPSGQFAQTLFSQIDTSGSGSITKSELEQAVTNAGGTTAAADALYAKLDPNNTGSVTEQQFAQALGQTLSHHHHFGGGANTDSGNSAQDALASLLQADASAGTGAVTTAAQFAQNLFSQIDTSGSGSITKSELEQAVTKAGGSTTAADALYAQLDPNNTGSVTEQQFAQALQPPSPSGTTAQDAVLALLDPSSQSTTGTSSSTGSDSTDTSGTSAVSGTTAQDALMALLNNIGSGNSTDTGTSGNTAQDALLALFNDGIGSALSTLGGSSQDPLLSLGQGSGNSFSFGSSGSTAQDALTALLQAIPTGSSTAAAGSSSTGNGTDIATAVALYQSQIDQQMLGTMFGTGSTSI